MMINPSLKRSFVSLKYLIVLSMVLDSGVFAQKSLSDEADWQQSAGVSIKLGVRDKYGELESYSALFVVTDPDGKEYKAMAKGDARSFISSFTYVYFPDGFEGEGGITVHESKWYPSPVIFSWKCIIGDKTVAKGKFEYQSGFQAKIIE